MLHLSWKLLCIFACIWRIVCHFSICVTVCYTLLEYYCVSLLAWVFLSFTPCLSIIVYHSLHKLYVCHSLHLYYCVSLIAWVSLSFTLWVSIHVCYFLRECYCVSQFMWVLLYVTPCKSIILCHCFREYFFCVTLRVFFFSRCSLYSAKKHFQLNTKFADKQQYKKNNGHEGTKTSLVKLSLSTGKCFHSMEISVAKVKKYSRECVRDILYLCECLKQDSNLFREKKNMTLGAWALQIAAVTFI